MGFNVACGDPDLSYLHWRVCYVLTINCLHGCVACGYAISYALVIVDL